VQAACKLLATAILVGAKDWREKLTALGSELFRLQSVLGKRLAWPVQLEGSSAVWLEMLETWELARLF
jgi:hypothetical protein